MMSIDMLERENVPALVEAPLTLRGSPWPSKIRCSRSLQSLHTFATGPYFIANESIFTYITFQH